MGLFGCSFYVLFANSVPQVPGLLLVPSKPVVELPLKACASIDELDCIEYADVMDEFDEASVRTMLRNDTSENTTSARNRSRPVMWVHIHKNAGSTICGLAAKNGETIVSPHQNCNWFGHDQYNLTNHHAITSCATRQQAFADQGATWGQIEREFHSGDLCQGFEYGIMLRDPLDHAVSFTRYERWDATPIVACLRARSCEGLGFHAYDNYMIRRMLGEAGLQIEPGNVTQEHAQTVIELLERFHVVAIQDDFGDALSAKLGWQHVRLLRNPTRTISNPIHKEAPISDEDLSFIYANTMMDRTVYEHFGGPKRAHGI